MQKYKLPIHFENPESIHEISAETLFEFINAYKEISKIFGISLDINVQVPTTGGWKSTLIFAVTAIGVSPIVTLISGETLEDWAKKGHHEIIKLVNDYINKKTTDIQIKVPNECIDQKNRIFKQMLKDNCVIGFKIGNFPSIPRANFHLYIEKPIDEKPIYLGITKIIVSSPDWHQKRAWRGRIEILGEQERVFDFEKSNTYVFWERVLNDELQLHTEDTMQVQLVEFPSRRVKYLVIRVLSYNNQLIDQSIDHHIIDEQYLKNNELNPIVSSHQIDLFKE